MKAARPRPLIAAALGLPLLAAGALLAPAAAVAQARDAKPAPAPLDTGVIATRSAASAPAGDAFAVRNWAPPPKPAPPPPPPEPAPPPPPPQAPALPFKYLGRLEESPERTTVYLAIGERLLVVSPGDIIDRVYRIDGYEAGQLRFTYLPLQIRQSMPIGAMP